LIEQVSLLDLGQTAQAVEQQTVDRLGGGAQRMTKGQVGYPSVPALRGVALAVESSKLKGKLISRNYTSLLAT